MALDRRKTKQSFGKMDDKRLLEEILKDLHTMVREVELMLAQIPQEGKIPMC
jgi:hypothetical protein